MNISNFDYGLLFIFKECAEAKSFSKTSEILHVKQPAISYSIKKLEELLNVKLFDRGSFGIELTEEGKILYDYIKQANNNIISGLSILNEFNNKEISEIKIGVTLNISLAVISKTIINFRKTFPNVKISIYSKSEENMIKDLQEKNLDVVIYNSAKENVVSNIKIRKIKNNNIVLAGTKKYKEKFELNDNKEIIPVILPSKNTNLGKNLKSNIEKDNFSYSECIYCQSAIIAKELLLSGIGIGYINVETIKNELDESKLFILSTNCNIDNYSINIATQNKNLNIVIKKFIEIFKEEVLNSYENN